MSFIKNYNWIIIAASTFILDRVTKGLVLNNIGFGQAINVFPIFNLTFIFNSGSAFGFLNDAGGWQRWFFIAIAVSVSICIIIWQSKNHCHAQLKKVALALILGGALGNAYDRAIYHNVIDFIHFYFKQWHYPTFNIADSAICVGSVLLILDSLKHNRKNNTKTV